MSLGNCIPGLVEAGKLTKKQGEAAQAVYDRHYRRLSAEMGPAAASAEASARAIGELEAAARQKKRQAFLQIDAQRRAREAMATYRGKGKGALGKAGEALFVRDDHAPYANVEYREKRRRNQALSIMQGVLEKHSRNLAGQVRDGAGLLDIQRELRGEKTGNVSAAELADAVRTAQDLQLRQYNAAGGAIRKLANRGVAQSYEPYKVGRAGLDQWKADELAHLDLKATAEAAGLAGPEEMDGYLGRVFEAINTDGAAFSGDKAGGGSRMLANRRQEHRALIYKSADDWQAIAEKYGNPNVYDAIMHETHAMSRDIAAMEILGPNPEATVRWIKDHVVDEAKRQHGAGTPEVDKARAAADRIGGYWDTYSGANAGARNWLSLVGSGLRAHQVASKLGSAAVTALPTDMATQALTRAFNGLPAAKTGLDYLKFMASSGAREQAGRFGFIADQSAAGFSTQARFMGAELTGEWQNRLAEGVMRMSGLNRLTDAGRDAFGMEALAHITDERGKAWGQLDPRFRRMFDRYGIDAAGWDAIRATPLSAAKDGSLWIHPDNMADRALADRVMETIYSETDLAVVTAGLKARAAINNVGKRGTWQGELARAFFQFKAFPIATLYLHGARMMSLESGFSKAKYGAAFLGAATAAGWLALEAKAITKGQDPRPLSMKTLFASLQQGGGLGIYGDFLFSTQARTGQGLSSVLLGPSTQTVDAVSGLLFGAPLLQAEGEKVDYDRQLIRLLRSETPGSSLWYARLGFDRLILDQWQAAADPHYNASWSRMQSRARDQGTGYWWAPGDTAPSRAPDLATAGPAQ